MPLIYAFDTFWNRYPALLYGLCVLIGFYAAFHWSWIIMVPLGVLLVPQLLAVCFGLDRSLSRAVLSLTLLLATIIYGTVNYTFPTLPPEGIKGTAHITLSSLRTRTTHFGRQWIYQGQIVQFTSDNAPNSLSIANHVAFTLSLPHNDTISRPTANQDYVIHATLKQTDNGQYILKVSPQEPWNPVHATWSPAESRYHAKQAVKAYISHHIANPHSASFLSGLATGEFEDRLFSFEFGRFGLQHIMAISGFHFSIIAAILGLFLRMAFTRKRGASVLVFLLCSYFLFLGCTPSIMRAWIAISIYLAGQLIEKKPSALNSLGFALLVILLIDPLACSSIGFQFSFLTTAAILLLYSGCDHLMEKMLTKRPLSQMISMDLLNQHGYYILSLFRQGVALGIAVNLVALPVTLFYFQKFPWMSLLYNLFFPMMVSVAMFLLLVAALLTYVIPLAAEGIHAFNSGYTQWMLNFTFNMPTSLDTYLRVDPLPPWILVCYLCALFVISIVIRQYMEKKQEELQDFAFL